MSNVDKDDQYHAMLDLEKRIGESEIEIICLKENISEIEDTYGSGTLLDLRHVGTVICVNGLLYRISNANEIDSSWTGSVLYTSAIRLQVVHRRPTNDPITFR